MPIVTLKYSDGTSQRSSGGCFGFSGRYGMDESAFNIPRRCTVTEYQYHVGEQMTNTRHMALQKYFNWLAKDSMWSKYVLGFCTSANDNNIETLSSEQAKNTNLRVRVRTDIEGNAVIGTASVFRLAGKREGKFLALWLKQVDAGVDPAVAFLVAYTQAKAYAGTIHRPNATRSERENAKFSSIIMSHDESYNVRGNMTTASSRMGLGDDEVLDLTQINHDWVTSFIRGDMEYYQEIDETLPQARQDDLAKTYANGGGYHQTVLKGCSMYSRAGNIRNFKNFAVYLAERFLVPRNPIRYFRVNSGMGGYSLQRNSAASIKTTARDVKNIVAMGLILTSEYEHFEQLVGLE